MKDKRERIKERKKEVTIIKTESRPCPVFIKTPD
jgi:hypothetical protein